MEVRLHGTVDGHEVLWAAGKLCVLNGDRSLGTKVLARWLFIGATSHGGEWGGKQQTRNERRLRQHTRVECLLNRSHSRLLNWQVPS